MSFFEELKRRNVFRVGAAYVVAAWLIVQVVETIFPAFGFGDAAIRNVVILLALGLLPVLILAWAFELTAEGIKRDREADRSTRALMQRRRLFNRALIVLLVAALSFFMVDKFLLAPKLLDLEPGRAESADAQEPAPARSVAVLPFVALSQGNDDEYFADGLTEEIMNSLASLSELRVTARTSAFHFKGTELPVPTIAETLGVANIVGGSVRRDGNRVRITAQLVRADDGFHLWSKSYDRTLDDVFAVQADIARNIAEVLNVVLDDASLQRMRGAGIGDVDAFIAYQKGSEAFAVAHRDIERVSEALSEANVWFDRVLEVAPDLTHVRLRRADLEGHKLFEIAAGYRPEAWPGEGAALVQSLLDQYALAWESARPGMERAIVEVERKLFSDDWSGMANTLDQAISGEECTAGNWINQLGDPYGRAARMVEWIRTNLRCDPLSGLGIMALASGLIWAGEPEEALQVLSEAEALDLSIPFLHDVRMTALLAAGNYQEDAQAYARGAQGTLYPFPDRFLLEALAGDPEKARRISDEYLADPGKDDYSSLIAAAVVGNRAAANTFAARIDARPGGPFMLVQIVQMCMCGAPFDLSVTPNFNARLQESGFQWPPPKPLDFPLKDW